jgi:prevent-host-death family protein
MHFTATQAKNRFGAVCAQAKDGPVFIEKDGRIDSVILSAKHYEALPPPCRTRLSRCSAAMPMWP